MKVSLHDIQSGELLDIVEVSEHIEEEPEETVVETTKPKNYEEYQQLKAERNKPKKRKKKNDRDPEFIWSCEFIPDGTYRFLTSCNNG